MTNASGIAHIRHCGPLIIGYGMEASYFLAARVVSKEFELSRNIHFRFLSVNITLFVCLWRWAISAAVFRYFFNSAKETRMTMEVYFTVFGLVPFGVQKKVLGVQKAIDLGSMILRTVGDRHLMVRRDFLLLNPFRNFILPAVFNISFQLLTVVKVLLNSRSTSLLTTLFHVRVSVGTLWELFDNEKSCKPARTVERTLKYCWVNSITFKQWPVYFETSMTILGETVSIRWRASGEINGVALSHKSRDSSWCCIYLVTIAVLRLSYD